MALGPTLHLTEMSTGEYFLAVKSARCVRLTTLPPSCPVVTKSGSLNFLEPSGPVQACNGTALPLAFGPTHHFLKLYTNAIQRHLRLISLN